MPLPQELPNLKRLAGCSSVALILFLAGCASSGSRPVRIAIGCEGERGAFERSVASLESVAPGFESLALSVAQAKPGTDAAAGAFRLAPQIDGVSQSVGLVANDFAALRTCRSDRIAAASEAAPQKAAYDAELDEARRSLALAQTVQATLAGAADRLAADSPSVKRAAARAVAAPPPPPQPFIAVQTATIHARPDAGSAPIADLRKGTRAQGPAAGTAAVGWTTLILNDGSLGYVESAALRPASVNPSAVAGARPQGQPAADPAIGLVIASRRTLPAIVAGLSAQIDAATAAETRLLVGKAPAGPGGKG
jgi:hypothetical protein